MAEVINGYELKRHLQTGQTSQVWEVVEVNSKRHFAMKLLLPEVASDPVQRRFLFHEANVGLQLAHPHVIKILKVSQSQKSPHFIMEFFSAGALKLRILRKENDFLMEHGWNIVKNGATALAFMNAHGWVHRDVKPDNFLVSSAGDLKLIDFALAKRIRTDFISKLIRRFSKRKAQGTRSYISPEQIRDQAIDGRADIYSFGATCYELVAGRPPFRGSTSQELLAKHIMEKPISPEQYNPEVTKEFADLILHMLQKKPEHRPKDFHQVLMALRTIKIFKNAPAKKES